MVKRLCLILTLCAFVTATYAQEHVYKPIIKNGTITNPGSYVLLRDLSANGVEPALTIQADDVTVNLNGYQISGPGNNTGTGILIEGATGVTVRNGFVRDHGFGITVVHSDSVTLEDLTINGRGIEVAMPPPEVGIMLVNSRSVTVKNNNIFGIGLGVFLRGPGSMGNHVYGNTITASMNGRLGVCFNPAPAPSPPGGPMGNTVEDNSITGFRYAVQVNAGGPIVVKNNTFFYTEGAFDLEDDSIVEDIGNIAVQLP